MNRATASLKYLIWILPLKGIDRSIIFISGINAKHNPHRYRPKTATVSDKGDRHSMTNRYIKLVNNCAILFPGKIPDEYKILNKDSIKVSFIGGGYGTVEGIYAQEILEILD